MYIEMIMSKDSHLPWDNMNYIPVIHAVFVADKSSRIADSRVYIWSNDEGRIMSQTFASAQCSRTAEEHRC